MSKKSAGIILYRTQNDLFEILLVHPGGPFWVKKDEGAWTIPKGEFDDEDPLEAAKREFEEETGKKVSGKFIELKPVKQKSGKLIFAWAVEGNMDTATIKSNEFEIEWPPGSGKMKSFPEIDKAGWFTIRDAAIKINPGQLSLIKELETKKQNAD